MCFYERTCGTKQAAEDRVKELTKRGKIAFYTIDHTINYAFY